MAPKTPFFGCKIQNFENFQKNFGMEVDPLGTNPKSLKNFFVPPTSWTAGPKNHFCLFREVKRRSPIFLVRGWSEVKKICVINSRLMTLQNEPPVERIRRFGWSAIAGSSRAQTVLKNAFVSLLPTLLHWWVWWNPWSEKKYPSKKFPPGTEKLVFHPGG